MPEINDKICVSCTASYSRSAWGKFALIVAAFAFAYGPIVPLLLDTWSYPDFSHGIIVPFVSIYLVWIRRAELEALPVKPSYAAGVLVMLAAMLILLLGRTGSVVIVQQASILVMIPGIVLLLLGTGYLRALALPLAYLVLMVPILTPLLEALYWPLQLITAKLSGLMLTAIGVPVYQSSQFLELPNIILEVAEACSGAQFLISVLAIAIPLAVIVLKRRRQKIALMGLAVLITIFSNALRVALIGWFAYTYNKKVAIHGPYHILTGYFVFMVGFVFLFLSTWALVRFFGGSAGQEEAGKDADATAVRAARQASGGQAAWAIAIIILIATGAFIYTYKATPVATTIPISTLPMVIDGWRGTDAMYENDKFRAPGADNEIIRHYKNADGRSLQLYVGYYKAQTQGKELIHVHFSSLYDKIDEINLASGPGQSFRVNKAVVREGSRQYLVMYWYDLNGRDMTNRYRTKFMTAVNGLLHRRTNGAVIIIKSPVALADDLQQAANDDKEFIMHLRPVLKEYLPSDL